MSQLIYSKFFFWCAILILTLIGAYLRIQNVSAFKFYPDAYQNLVVAENILRYYSVVGFLGERGMFYPDFLMWTRPVYPLVINLLRPFFVSTDMAAQFISTALSILSIPLAYILIWKIFRLKWAAILGVLLLGISFNLVVWSGFVYTESLAIFLNLVFLISLVRRIKKPAKFLGLADLLTGAILALTVFARYEYILFVIPIGFLIFNQNPTAKIKALNIFLSFVFFSLIFLLQLFPVQDLAFVVLEQFSKLLVVGGGLGVGVLILGGIYFYFRKRIGESYVERFFNGLIGLVVVLGMVMILQIIWGPSIFLYDTFEAIRKFFLFDFLLGFTFFGGLVLLLKDPVNRVWGMFVVLTVVLLWPIYNNINPAMQRYWSHFLPFLIIPSSYFFIRIWEISKKYVSRKILVLLFLTICLGQVFVSGRGIQYWDEGAWFRVSYEEKAGKTLGGMSNNTNVKYIPMSNESSNSGLGQNDSEVGKQARMTDMDPGSGSGMTDMAESGMTMQKEPSLLIASFPEAYYYFTKVSTHSVADSPPFVYVDEKYDDEVVWIVEDMGMRDVFPEFSRVLEKGFSDKVIDSFWVGEDYHFGNRTVKEDKPVRVYQVTLGELKEKIRESFD